LKPLSFNKKVWFTISSVRQYLPGVIRELEDLTGENEKTRFLPEKDLGNCNFHPLKGANSKTGSPGVVPRDPFYLKLWRLLNSVLLLLMAGVVLAALLFSLTVQAIYGVTSRYLSKAVPRHKV